MCSCGVVYSHHTSCGMVTTPHVLMWSSLQSPYLMWYGHHTSCGMVTTPHVVWSLHLMCSCGVVYSHHTSCGMVTTPHVLMWSSLLHGMPDTPAQHTPAPMPHPYHTPVPYPAQPLPNPCHTPHPTPGLSSHCATKSPPEIAPRPACLHHMRLSSAHQPHEAQQCTHQGTSP